MRLTHRSARIGGIFVVSSRAFAALTCRPQVSAILDSLIPSRMADLITRYRTHIEKMKPARDIAPHQITSRTSSRSKSIFDSSSSVVAPSQVLGGEYAESCFCPPAGCESPGSVVTAPPGVVQSRGTPNRLAWLHVRLFLESGPLPSP